MARSLSASFLVFPRPSNSVTSPLTITDNVAFQSGFGVLDISVYEGLGGVLFALAASGIAVNFVARSFSASFLFLPRPSKSVSSPRTRILIVAFHSGFGDFDSSVKVGVGELPLAFAVHNS